MVLFGGILDVGIALLVVTALAEYARYRERRQQAFRLLAAAGFLFVVAGLFENPSTAGFSYFGGAHTILVSIMQSLGEVVAVVSAIVLAYDVATEKRKR